ncbi:hypothetical protein GG344DRAFT_83317 [Lentinula edodes]|nr:hypothetical protein GG344DRAFT_83317 [Lentinula edodes]
MSAYPGNYQDSPSISQTPSHSALTHLRTSPRQYHLPSSVPSSFRHEDLPSQAYIFSGAYTLKTHLHLQPTRSYIDVLASTTPTTQYHMVPHSYLTSLRLRDLPVPPRNPLKGHHLVVPATTRSFPSLVAVPVAPFKLQPAPSTLQHKPPHTKTYPKTYFDPGLTGRFLGTGLEDGRPRVLKVVTEK